MHEGPQYEEERAIPDTSMGEGEEFVHELSSEGTDELRKLYESVEEGLGDLPLEAEGTIEEIAAMTGLPTEEIEERLKKNKEGSL